jgi:UDP-3-O-[3-hydroxymyristoyl] glucosamine N-acyltransferase
VSSLSDLREDLAHVAGLGRLTIGERVQIGPGVQLAVEGFGYKLVHGRWMRKSQSCGVRISADVDIGANTVIARGSYRDTTIGRGTKIDAMVFIAHNVMVGRNCLIVAHSEISGSVVIQDDVIIGPNVTIKEHVTIGRGALIGAGAVVLKDVPPGEVWVGNPAHYLRMRKAGEAI